MHAHSHSVRYSQGPSSFTDRPPPCLSIPSLIPPSHRYLLLSLSGELKPPYDQEDYRPLGADGGGGIGVGGEISTVIVSLETGEQSSRPRVPWSTQRYE